MSCCFNLSVAPCPADVDTTTIEVQGRCFLLYTRRSLSWFEAFEECARDGRTLAALPGKMYKLAVLELLLQKHYYVLKGQKLWIAWANLQWRWLNGKSD